MKNINLLGCHLLSPFLPSLRRWEPDSTRNPAVLWHLCLDISTQTHHGWLLGQWQHTPKWDTGRGKKQWFPAPPEIQTPKKIVVFEIMDWHTSVNCYRWRNLEHIWPLGPGSLVGVTQQVVQFWKICIKNLRDARNIFTFGYVEVQRLCAVADTAAFALALF